MRTIWLANRLPALGVLARAVPDAPPGRVRLEYRPLDTKDAWGPWDPTKFRPAANPTATAPDSPLRDGPDGATQVFPFELPDSPAMALFYATGPDGGPGAFLDQCPVDPQDFQALTGTLQILRR